MDHLIIKFMSPNPKCLKYVLQSKPRVKFDSRMDFPKACYNHKCRICRCLTNIPRFSHLTSVSPVSGRVTTVLGGSPSWNENMLTVFLYFYIMIIL